jgi:uncharacterized protein (TIGR00730 family)
MAEDSSDLVSLSNERAAIEILGESVQELWDVVSKLTRLRPTKREDFRVTIFGSAQIPSDHWVYAAVRDLAAELARLGCGIVTGGGPGLMQAANEGAATAGSRNVGIRVHLPFEQDTNAFVTEAYEHREFFSRLHHFVLVSDAFVVVPGGIGTVLELSMIWQLLQVRKMRRAPLICIGKMWAELISWAQNYMCNPKNPLLNPDDLTIPQCVTTAEEALAIIRPAYARWASENAKETGF